MNTYVNACNYKTSQNQPTIAKQPGKTNNQTSCKVHD